MVDVKRDLAQIVFAYVTNTILLEAEVEPEQNPGAASSSFISSLNENNPAVNLLEVLDCISRPVLKELLMTFKQNETANFRQVASIIRHSSFASLSHLVKEIIKQGFYSKVVS